MAIDMAQRLMQFKRVIKTYGIAVPPEVQKALDAKSPLTLPDTNATAAAVVAAMDGKNPAKDVQAAISEYAALTVARQDGVFGRVSDALNGAAIRAVRDNADAIHAAAAKAMSPHIEKLATVAASVPGTTSPSDRTIPARVLVDVEAGQAAVKDLTDVIAATRILYGDVKAPLALVRFPESLTRKEWLTFAYAIEGKRQVNTGAGSTSLPALFWALCQDYGASFALLSPAESKANAERLQVALTSLSVGQAADEVVALSTGGDVSWSDE